MKKNKIIFIIIAFLVLGSTIFMLTSSPEEKNMKIHQEVYELGLKKYQEMIANCSGTYLFDLKIGEKLNLEEIPKTNCHSENVYSKINGYANYNDKVEIYVNVLEVNENKIYDLNHKYLGDYNESNLNEYYLSGSVLLYTFTCTDVCLLESVTYQS